LLRHAAKQSNIFLTGSFKSIKCGMLGAMQRPEPQIDMSIDRLLVVLL
jgi:hypothetical protein